jgi:hypothetical protein
MERMLWRLDSQGNGDPENQPLYGVKKRDALVQSDAMVFESSSYWARTWPDAERASLHPLL